MVEMLTNLLPEERVRAIRRDYLLRLAIVSACMIAALALVAAVLLLPAYIYLSQSVRAKEARLVSIEGALTSSDDTLLSGRLKRLATDVTAIQAFGSAPTASAVLRSALAVPHPGVALTSFTYAPAGAKKKGTLVITGVATTRDALRSYQLALEQAPLFIGADLPVAAFAKDANSSFAVTLTLAP